MKTRISLLACIISCLSFSTPQQAIVLHPQIASENVADDPFQNGIDLFNKGRYAEAVKAFTKAREQTPAKQAVYLWLGIAYVAAGDKSMAHNTWLKMPVETGAMVMTMYLKGLADWKEGKTADAKYWFNNTASYPTVPAHQLAKKALAQIERGEAAPPVSKWPSLAALTGEKKMAADPKALPATNENMKAPKMPAALPVGTYQCYDMYTEMSQPTRTTYKEKLIIRNATTYEYKSGKSSSGIYRYDAATGNITFISGPYKGGNLKARFSYQTADNKPLITLTYSFKNLGTDEDFCVFVGQ